MSIHVGPRAGVRRKLVGPGLAVLAALALGGALGGPGTGCAPSMSGVGGSGEDLGATTRDLGQVSCVEVPNNLLVNPGFEVVAVGEGDGNGRAKNTGSPASTIPLWDGCCNQSPGGTEWLVTQGMPRCGVRAVFVSSTTANDNVLNQMLTRGSDVGRSFQASAWVYLQEASAGAQLKLDVFDDVAKAVLRSSDPLTAATAGWTQLTLSGQIPSGGRVQLRLVSTGTLKALADDLVFTVQ